MKILRLIVQVALAVAIIALLAVFWKLIASVLATFFGFSNGSGDSSHYLFWSGSGSDFGELAIITGAVVMYRRLNCKRTWCPLMGMHDFTDPADGVTRKLCWYHHPDVLHKTLKGHHIERIQARVEEVRKDEQTGSGTVQGSTEESRAGIP
jgi:hypothetical protein